MNASSHSFFVIITDIGDSASHLALIAAASTYLIVRRAKRAAMFLALSFILSVTSIGFLKLAFASCHDYFHKSSLHSPSGHAAMSAAVFWAFAVLMRSQLEASRRFLPLLLFTLLIAGIAASRVVLGYHTVNEVIMGLVTGWLSMLAARFLILRGKPHSPFDAYALALWGVIAVFIAHGVHLQGEDLIQILASHVAKHVSFCIKSL